MRLFFAIIPEEPCLSMLWGARQQLKQVADTGSFPLRENIHLTVQYLGETQNPEQARRCLKAVKQYPFTIKMDGLERFVRNDGDIVWAKTNQPPALEGLNLSVRRELDGAGLCYDPKPFKAHITLARRFRLPPGLTFDAVKNLLLPCETRVDTLWLMESRRERGRLVYLPLAPQKLGM